MPFVFTAHGVAMLSSVLSSERAIEVNIAIIRAFVRMRSLISQNKELSKEVDELERKYSSHDADLTVLLDALKQLMQPAKEQSKRRIGFHQE